MSTTNESIWNDIRRRGIGADIKKEDNVNNMGVDDFVDYLVANYRDKVYSMDKDHFCKEYEMDIVVNPIKDIVIYGSYVNDELSRIMVVLRNRGQIRLDDWVAKIIENSPDDFRWICMYSDRYELKLKKGDITNQTYVDLIEFFLNNITLFESVWGDIRRRGNGSDIKQEDDVNHMDFDTFADYIEDNYSEKGNWFAIRESEDGKSRHIEIDIIHRKEIDLTFNVVKGEIYNILVHGNKSYVDIPGLKQIFNVNIIGSSTFSVYEKNWTISNNTFVKLIEFFLDKKTTNESVWGDIRRRGNGTDVKKEDDVNLLDIDGLYDYIKSKYEKRLFYLDKDVYGPLNKKNIVADVLSNVSLFTIYDKKGNLEYILLSWSKVKIGMPFFDKLSERFNVQSPNVCRRRITEKDGTCTNQTYIDVIDFFLENMDNMLVNESVWNDIRKRGVGDSVKQEEFTEEFIDKVKSDLIGFTMSVVYYIENYELTFDGFYKYLEEIENPDEVKKIIYYVKTHKDECDKLLEKDIKFENKLLDEKVNVHLLRFVDNIVYDEKCHNTLSDIKKFASEIFKGHKSSYNFHINKKLVFKDKSELFNDYIEDKWKDGSLKQKIDDLIKNENDEISKYGFVKEPGKTIADTVNDWWDSLDDSKRDELAWDEFGEDAEEAWMSEHHRDVDYDGEDFDADEWWDNAYGIRRVKIYCSEHSKTNESVWNDIRRRGNGTDVKKEDEMTQDDFLMLRGTAKMFLVGVRNYSNPKNRKYAPRRIDGQEGFIDYILERKKEHFWNAPDEVYDKLIKFVKDNWGDCTGIQEFMDKYLSNINECDGVPGGLTPADVGGMGPAYFPGPNGEPGSGDLPMPTGHVYHQVAPFGVFIKELKKKKKKKKFRKEDEPCSHSPNAKVYDYVDDYREYVDRTYTMMNRRK